METSQPINAATKVSNALTANPSSFLTKLFNIVETTEIQHIVSWDEEGKALVIKNSGEFIQNVLPKFFKHGNISSFIRQLNLYNFKKMKSKLYEYVFSHDQFQRDNKHLLVNIKRKSSSLLKILSNSDFDFKNGEAGNTESLYQENVGLKKMQKELTNKMRDLETQINNLTKINQDLAQETLKLQPSTENKSASTDSPQVQILPQRSLSPRIQAAPQIYYENPMQRIAPARQYIMPSLSTQGVGFNPVQNYQPIQFIPQDGMAPIVLNPNRFQSNPYPIIIAQDPMHQQQQQAFSMPKNIVQPEHHQPLIIFPSEMGRNQGNTFFHRENVLPQRPSGYYDGKSSNSDLEDNKAEGAQFLGFQHNLIKAEDFYTSIPRSNQ